MALEHDAARLVGSLHALQQRTDAAEQRILDAALAREEHVLRRMEELQPMAIASSRASREYQTLAVERRRLNVVIALARRNVSGADGSDG